jgi:hypothetical protein
LADDVGQPLEDTHIGDHADGRFLQAKRGVFRTKPDIASADHVKPAADAHPMHDRDDRFAAYLHNVATVKECLELVLKIVFIRI